MLTRKATYVPIFASNDSRFFIELSLYLSDLVGRYQTLSDFVPPTPALFFDIRHERLATVSNSAAADKRRSMA